MYDQDDLNVPIYEKSQFYQDFLVQKDDVKKSLTYCDENSANPYYNEKYLDEFLKKDVPYLSLWSGLLNNSVRYSNQSIEGYIGRYKSVFFFFF